LVFLKPPQRRAPRSHRSNFDLGNDGFLEPPTINPEEEREH
jgi:hypothetical protein